MTQEVVSQLDLADVSRIYAERQGCSQAEATFAVEEYRMFLVVVAANPDLKCVPNERQDRVWHICMEDTDKYEHDCMHLFGRLLEHDADYFGTPAFNASWQATRNATRCQFWVDPGSRHRGARCAGMDETFAAKCGGMLAESAARCGGMLRRGA